MMPFILFALVFGLLILGAWKMKPRRRHRNPLIECLINTPGFIALWPMDGESENVYAETINLNDE